MVLVPDVRVRVRRSRLVALPLAFLGCGAIDSGGDGGKTWTKGEVWNFFTQF